MNISILYSINKKEAVIITSLIIQFKKFGHNVVVNEYTNGISQLNTLTSIDLLVVLATETRKPTSLENYMHGYSEVQGIALIDESINISIPKNWNKITLYRDNIENTTNEILSLSITSDSSDQIKSAITKAMSFYEKNIHLPKVKQIQQALKIIDPERFQELCAFYLYYALNGVEISRPGSQIGSYKTTKGSPDFFFINKLGNYIFVECTTTQGSKQLLSKLKNDINKHSLKNESAFDIELLVLCFNSKVNPEHSQTLHKFAEINGLRIQLIGIDKLGFDIFSRYQNLAKDYLNITIDTNQILSIVEFIKEYEFTGLATPLTNKMFFRSEDKNALLNSIATHHITILTGSAGVGKSKLAIEVLNEKEKNNEAKVYCITNKGASLVDDLRIYLNERLPYIILIDDAHRNVVHLLSVLAIMKERQNIDIKIVLTVRDYSKTAVFEKCDGYNYNSIEISRHTDDQIKEIITSDDFNILNKEFQRRIK